MKSYYCLLIVAVLFAGCKKDSPKPPVVVNPITGTKVTNTEYIDSLLFVTGNNYQIKTSEEATFSSTDPHIQINSAGVVARLTGGEVVPIVVKWKNPAHAATTIYAVGADDSIQDYPFTLFHGEIATDSYGNLVQGWKTLQKLPIADETYAIVLRHADASFGRDWTTIHTGTAPANWWKSTDSTLARQINTQGMDRGTQLGQIFKDLKYPVARIVTSEFYRARQTATLMNLGVAASIDGRINHLTHNTYVPGLYQGMLDIMQAQPVDNKMTLIIAHHPINELNGLTGYPTFPQVSVFNWTGAYLIKVYANKSITYEGAASFGMFKYWRNLKLHVNN